MTLSGASAQQNSSGSRYFTFRVEPSDLITTGDPTTDPLESPPEHKLRDPRELHRNISQFIEQRGPYGTQQGSSAIS